MSSIRELAKELSKEDFERLFSEDDRFAGHAGTKAEQLANKRIEAQRRLDQQAAERIQDDQLRQTDKVAWAEKHAQEADKLSELESVVAGAFSSFDKPWLDRYHALPDDLKKDLGDNPHADPIQQRLWFIDAVVKAENTADLQKKLKTATDEAFEAGRTAERAERGKTLPVPEVGASTRGAPVGDAVMTQDEFDARPRTTSGGLDRTWWNANKSRVLAGQKAGLITRQ